MCNAFLYDNNETITMYRRRFKRKWQLAIEWVKDIICVDDPKMQEFREWIIEDRGVVDGTAINYIYALAVSDEETKHKSYGTAKRAFDQFIAATEVQVETEDKVIEEEVTERVKETRMTYHAIERLAERWPNVDDRKFITMVEGFPDSINYTTKVGMKKLKKELHWFGLGYMNMIIVLAESP